MEDHSDSNLVKIPPQPSPQARREPVPLLAGEYRGGLRLVLNHRGSTLEAEKRATLGLLTAEPQHTRSQSTERDYCEASACSTLPAVSSVYPDFVTAAVSNATGAVAL